MMIEFGSADRGLFEVYSKKIEYLDGIDQILFTVIGGTEEPEIRVMLDPSV